jgi:hypothetical protein
MFGGKSFCAICVNYTADYFETNSQTPFNFFFLTIIFFQSIRVPFLSELFYKNFMSTIRKDLAYAVLAKSNALIDYDIHNDIHKQYKFQQQIVLSDNSLTKDEKTYAINLITRSYDRDKILNNSGTKRTCENCKEGCLATLYCEFCVRNYLKAKFSNWTSGNDDVDKLIQKCQMETLHPQMIVEWIPYNNLQDIKYLTKGGFSEIYTAIWIDGRYDEWDFKEQQLERCGTIRVILKKLENVESANQSWFEEVCNQNLLKRS